MIFLTVGSQMPFDRLVRAADGWAAKPGTEEVFAQIGNSDFEPQHMRSVRALSPTEFRRSVLRSRLVVAHAGMGTVLTAMEHGKPVVVMPRRGALRETRNDHQVATARWLSTRPGIRVAMNDDELGSAIESLLGSRGDAARVSDQAPRQLLDAIHRFITQRTPG